MSDMKDILSRAQISHVARKKDDKRWRKNGQKVAKAFGTIKRGSHFKKSEYPADPK